MATAPPKDKSKGKILGMSYLTAGLGAAGLLLAWYLYRRMQASNAASAAQQSTGLVGGNTVPSGQSQGSSSLPSFSSFSQWEQAALSSMTGPGYSASQALNDLVGWVSGQCVSKQGYTSIGNAIATQGLPPGFGTSLPPLTVCSSSTSSGKSTSSGTSDYSIVPSHAANLADQAAGLSQYLWDATTGTFVLDTNPSAYNGVTYTKGPGASTGSGSSVGGTGATTITTQSVPMRPATGTG